jgi:hypothetical protein
MDKSYPCKDGRFLKIWWKSLASRKKY